MTLKIAIYLILFAAIGLFLACGWTTSPEPLPPIESSAGQIQLVDATVEAVPEQVSDSVPERSTIVTGFSADFGLSSLKEQIARADVISRVTLHSVSSSTEQFDTPDSFQTDETAKDGDVRSIEFTFDVHDYLKGTGSTTLVAVVFGGQSYPTATEAEANGPDLSAERDTQWDSREAIVFLKVVINGSLGLIRPTVIGSVGDLDTCSTAESLNSGCQ